MRQKVCDMNTIKLSDTHLRVINTALECLYRLRSGQIRYALEAAYTQSVYGYDDLKHIEKQIRDIFLPELQATGGNYSFSSKQMGFASIGYEIQKTFEEFLSVKNNDGYYGTTTNFYGPLKASSEPLPEVVGFHRYKDFILTQEQSDKIRKLSNKKQYNKMWEYISSIQKFRGEKTQIIEDINRITLRVWRPQKIDQEVK